VFREAIGGKLGPPEAKQSKRRQTPAVEILSEMKKPAPDGAGVGVGSAERGRCDVLLALAPEEVGARSPDGMSEGVAVEDPV
jgi:hypothetical protein